jgi:hypothetical protein
VADDIVLINVPGPGDPSVVEVVTPGNGTVTVPSGGFSQAAVQGMVDDALVGHTADATPHSAYDDLPSLTLLFENGLV